MWHLKVIVRKNNSWLFGENGILKLAKLFRRRKKIMKKCFDTSKLSVLIKANFSSQI